MSQSLIQQARDIASDQYIRLEMKRVTPFRGATEWADHIQAYSDLMRTGSYDDDLAVQSAIVALRSVPA